MITAKSDHYRYHFPCVIFLFLITVLSLLFLISYLWGDALLLNKYPVPQQTLTQWFLYWLKSLAWITYDIGGYKIVLQIRFSDSVILSTNWWHFFVKRFLFSTCIPSFLSITIDNWFFFIMLNTVILFDA